MKIIFIIIIIITFTGCNNSSNKKRVLSIPSSKASPIDNNDNGDNNNGNNENNDNLNDYYVKFSFDNNYADSQSQDLISGNCNGNICPTFVSGKFGNALSFNGINNYLSIPLNQLNEDFTMSLWIKFDFSSLPWSSIFTFNGTPFLSYTEVKNELYFFDSGMKITSLNQHFNENTWYNFILTYNRTNNENIVYVNGVMKGISESPGFTSKLLFLGKQSATQEIYSKSTLDELTIWNRILSPQEIEQYYNSGAIPQKQLFERKHVFYTNFYYNLGWFDKTKTRLKGDFNGDGKDDLLYFNYGRQHLYVWGESEDEWKQLWSMPLDQSQRYEVILSGDFNGDRKDDILFFTADGKLLAHNSTGNNFPQNPSSVTNSNYDLNNKPELWNNGITKLKRHITTGDFNGDGLTDIVFFFNDGSVNIWLNNGNGFTNSGTTQTPYTDADSWFLSDDLKHIGDINGDGRDDLVFISYHGDIVIWIANESGTQFTNTSFIEAGLISTLWNFQENRFKLGDFNGDGKKDLLVFKPDGKIEFYISNGNTFNLNPLKLSTPYNQAFGWFFGSERVLVGDFNGDGKDDIAFFELGGQGYIWESNIEISTIPSQTETSNCTTSFDCPSDEYCIRKQCQASSNLISCSNNNACNDGYPFTNDICINPGTINSYCTHEGNRPISFAYGFDVKKYDEWLNSGIYGALDVLQIDSGLEMDLSNKNNLAILSNAKLYGKIISALASVFYENYEQYSLIDNQNIVKGMFDKMRLPLDQGFDAISIDEITPFIAPKYFSAIVDAIELVKKFYPGKLIFTWGTFVCYQDATIQTDCNLADLDLSKNMIYTDFHLVEVYAQESSTAKIEESLSTLASNTLTWIPQGLPNSSKKILYGLGVSDTEAYTMDHRPDIDFKKMLDKEMKIVKQAISLSKGNGVAFWTVAWANFETKSWIAKLLKHYLPNSSEHPTFENSSALLTNGNYILNYLQNPGFENGLNYWTIFSTQTITIQEFNKTGWFSSKTPDNLTGYDMAHVLKFVRSSEINSAYQVANNLIPGQKYFLEAYSKKNNLNLISDIKTNVLKTDWSALDHEYLRQGSCLMIYGFNYEEPIENCYEETYYWIKESIIFTAPSNGSIIIFIDDLNASSGAQHIIDFIQLQEYTLP